MRHVFMDESGSLGFGPGGTEYFVLAIISPESGSALNKCMKNFNAHLIANGWNPKVEIKASNVWNSPRSCCITQYKVLKLRCLSFLQ